MNSDSEMYPHEVHMAEEVILGHMITWAVMDVYKFEEMTWVYREWDPGEMNSDSEMYLHEVHMAEKVIMGHMITWAVMEGDTEKQCHEGAIAEYLLKEDAVLGMRQLYETNKVVWDTGQQAHMGHIARMKQEMVYQSASLGWCTFFRGTDAEGDGLGGTQECGAGEQPAAEPAANGRDAYWRDSDSQASYQGGEGGEPQVQGLCQLDELPQQVYAGVPCTGEGGGVNGSDIVRCRLQEEHNKAYCRVTFRFSTCTEVHAHTDTLVGQPPYLVRQGWEQDVPGD